ncbi:MAG: ATP-binding protein, partial [Gammaproteobacteria bacterium]|nr:ATP-binding protein [Gammaproteobacteria bacterium]
MNRTELLDLIANRENSRVEFKRDDCRPETLAKEMSALLNLEGGVILLGVEKDQRVT